MIRSTGSREALGRTLMIALALAAGVLTAPLAASAAHADGAAPAASSPRFMDADTDAALYVGVRQAAVGDSVPVTVVGGEEGTVWEISLVSPETTLGALTIGPDGTGTTLVALPVGTSPGSIEIAASTADAELSTAISSAGDASSTAAVPDTEPQAAAAAAGIPAGPLVVGGAALAAGLAASAVVVAVRRGRRAVP